MSIILVIFSILLITSTIFNKGKDTFRLVFLKALLILYTYIFFLFEGLSLFNQLNSHSIVSFTAIAVLLLSLVLYIRIYKSGLSIFRFNYKYYFNDWKLLIIFFFLLILVFIGIYYPPNNWDSMTYHLARIGFWIQNSSTSFFPTNNHRQLYSGPLSEYFLAFLLLIDRSDNFLFFGQFLAMIGSLAATSLIARDVFKFNKKIQIFSVILGLLVPMGLLQSVSTQNDYVVTFFVTSFFYFFMMAKESVFIYLSFSLAVLTKITAVFYLLLPFIFWFKENLIKRKYIVLISFFTVFLAINSLHFYRNFEYFGSIFGSESGIYILESFSPFYFIVNFFKNLSVHLQLPNKIWNEMIVGIVEKISSVFYVNINDLNISFLSEKYTPIRKSFFDHDFTGNFVYIILVFLLVKKYSFRKNTSYLEKKYFLFLLFGFSLILFLIKWNPYVSRLHLPFFILLSPLLAIFISKKDKIFQYFLFLILIVYGIILILFNTSQPLGKIYQYQDREKSRYIKKPYDYYEYLKITQYFLKSKVKSVGIISEGDDWEYPFWFYLYTHNAVFDFKHIMNESVDVEFRPEMIIDLRMSVQESEANYVFYKDDYFFKDINGETIDLWVKNEFPIQEDAKNILNGI